MTGAASPRLTSAMVVSILCRRVQGAGGFATVLHHGDDHAGAILIECTDRGQRQILLERATASDGREQWRDVGVSQDMTLEDYAKMMEKRLRSDPDMWVIELDIPDAARFAADLFE